MTCPIQLGKELAATLEKFKPVKPQPSAYQLKRRKQISESMRRLRDKWTRAGLNRSGKKYKNK